MVRDRDCLLVVLVTMALLAGLVMHVPGLNGPWYWQWQWRRLGWGLYAMLAAGALPFFVAQWLFRRSVARRMVVCLGLLMLSLVALEFLAMAGQSPPFGLSRLTNIVNSPTATSYFTDAVFLSDQPDWLRRYSELLPSLSLHSQTKPPGPILYYLAFVRVFGSSAAPIAGATLGLLAALGVPAVYRLMDSAGLSGGTAFAGASLAALSPGLILFFPEFDQIYPMLSCGLVVSWVSALRSGRSSSAAACGLWLAVACLFTYNLLVLGVYLVGYGVWAWRCDATTIGRTIRQGTLALAVLVCCGLLTWATTGFDPITAFGTSWHLQRQLLGEIPRPYPATAFYDVTDFALGMGWIPFGLAGLGTCRWVRVRPLKDLPTALALLAWLQILVVTALALLPGETARVWLFMFPLLLIPAAGALDHFRSGARQVVYVCLCLLLTGICQNMVFIEP